jgi:hypothetical protein
VIREALPEILAFGSKQVQSQGETMKVVQIHARGVIASSLLAASLISSTAHADLYAEASAITAGAVSSGTVVVNNGAQHLREATAYTPNYYSGNDPFAKAVGQATYDWITADIVRQGDGFPTASATAQWIDTLTIDSSGYTGQQGYVTASIYVSTTAYAPGGPLAGRRKIDTI